jgi:hypothetical protein
MPESKENISALPREHRIVGWGSSIRLKSIVGKESARIFMEKNGRLLDKPILNLDFSTHERQGHNLQRGLSSPVSHIHAFKRAYTTVIVGAFPSHYFFARPHMEKKPEAQGRLISFLSAEQDRFLTTLDPEIAKFARRYTSNRWDIYRFLRAYRDPRIRQLLSSCPALVGILAVERYSRRIRAEIFDRTISQATSGNRLNDVLRTVFECICESPSDRQISGLWRESHLANEEVFCRWAWLLRKSPAAVNVMSLYLPPPLYIPMATLPSTARARAGWIFALKFFDFTRHTRSSRLSEGQVRGFLNFIGKHPSVIRLLQAHRSRKNIAGYLEATNAHPNSRTDPVRFAREFRAWECAQQLQQSQRSRIPSDLQLHTNDIQVEEGKVHLKSLMTPADYLRAGSQLRNCLGVSAFLWDSARNGRVIHFTGKIDNREFAMEIQRYPYGWAITQIYGQANSAVAANEGAVIRELTARSIIPLLPAPTARS